MMKKMIKALLHSAGYTVTRNQPAAVPVQPPPPAPANCKVIETNFENLVRAHEWTLNRLRPDTAIQHNPRRSALLARGLGTPPSEAFYLIEGLARTKTLAGDVCEFGVAQGETSALIANEILDTDKRLHLFDSFEGLPAPTSKDQLKDDIFSLGAIENYKGTMSCPEDMVLSRMNAVSMPADRYVIHKGFIQEPVTSSQPLPARVSFAYVDFDFYEPIKIALNYLDPIMPVGAIIVVDDYDFFSTGAKTAVDEFVQKSGRFSIEIPDRVHGYFAVLTKRS